MPSNWATTHACDAPACAKASDTYDQTHDGVAAQQVSESESVDPAKGWQVHDCCAKTAPLQLIAFDREGHG